VAIEVKLKIEVKLGV